MAKRRRPFAKVPPGYPRGEPGDLFFTRGLSGLSSAIRWAERTHGEAPSWANHAGIVTRPGYLVPPPELERALRLELAPGASLEEGPELAWVSEALWRVTHHEWWSAYSDSPGYEVAVYRVKAFTDQDRRDVVADALSRTGNRYGWWRLFTFLGETLSNRATGGRLTIPFTRLHFQRTRVVCSNHQARALAAARSNPFTFGGLDPKGVDPDEGMDYCRAHGGQVELVGRAIVSHPRRTQ